MVYVDNTLLAGDAYQECCNNINAIVSLLPNLGLTIHPMKWSFVSSQGKIFLGFIINKQNMTITITNEKKLKIHECAKMLLVGPPTIRKVAKS